MTENLLDVGVHAPSLSSIAMSRRDPPDVVVSIRQLEELVQGAFLDGCHGGKLVPRTHVADFIKEKGLMNPTTYVAAALKHGRFDERALATKGRTVLTITAEFQERGAIFHHMSLAATR